MPMYSRHRSTGKHSRAPKYEEKRKRDRSQWKGDTSASSNTNYSDRDCDGCVPSVVPFRISSESDCYPLSDNLSTEESRHANPTLVNYNKCRDVLCPIRNDSSSSCESRPKYRTRKKEVYGRRHQNIKPPIAPKPNFHIYVSEKKTKRNQMISPSKSDESIFARRNAHPDIEVIRIPSSPRSYEKRGARNRRRTCSGERFSVDEERLRPKMNDKFSQPMHSIDKIHPRGVYDDHKYRHFRELLSSSSSSSEQECARFQCSQRSNRHVKDVKHETFNSRNRGNYTRNIPHDDDQMFLLSILPTMKKLNDSNKMSAKVKILSTLQKAAESSSPPSYTPRMFAETSSRPMSPISDGFCSLKNIREAYRELCVNLKNCH